MQVWRTFIGWRIRVFTSGATDVEAIQSSESYNMNKAKDLWELVKKLYLGMLALIFFVYNLAPYATKSCNCQIIITDFLPKKKSKRVQLYMFPYDIYTNTFEDSISFFLYHFFYISAVPPSSCFSVNSAAASMSRSQAKDSGRC